MEPYARFSEREDEGDSAEEHEDETGMAERWVSFLQQRGGKYAVTLLWLGVLAAATVYAPKGMANLRLSVDSPEGSPSAVAREAFQSAYPDKVKNSQMSSCIASSKVFWWYTQRARAGK